MPKLLTTYGLLVKRVSALKQGLGDKGIENWQDFRKIAQSFPLKPKIQFLSLDPSILTKMRYFAESSSQLFINLGIKKWDFIEFWGFVNLCRIQTAEERIKVAGDNAEQLQRAGEIEKAKIFKIIALDMVDLLKNPRIPASELFVSNTAKFKILVEANTCPEVFLAFEHPCYIWITRDKLPYRVNQEFGKWIVNANNTEEPFKFARSLLPFFGRGKLGRLKFEIGTRGNGISCLIVYSAKEDPDVRKLVKDAAGGQNPFWVPDRFCFEAEALSQLIYLLAGYFDPAKIIDFEALAQRLQDRQFLNPRGLSSIQSEIILRLLFPEKPAYQDSNNAFSHVVDGYFKPGMEAGSFENYSSPPPLKIISRVIAGILLNESIKNEIHQLLTFQRREFERIYPAA